MICVAGTPFALNITDILPDAGIGSGGENEWVLFVFAALVLGIIIGGTMRGLAKLFLGLVILSGFVILILLVMQKQDVLSMIASVVFGVIMLVTSFLVKVGKYPIPKR